VQTQAGQLFNENGKRENEEEDIQMTGVSITELYGFIAKEAKQYKKKQKTNEPKLPVYQEDKIPVQQLYELHPNLIFKFDLNTSTKPVTYICSVDINFEQKDFKFAGDGVSKKAAKKKCCFLALCSVYSQSYTPPQHIIDSYNPQKLDQTTAKVTTQIDEAKMRLEKILKKNNKLKHPVQLLNEVSSSIFETGKCVAENGAAPNQKYTFQFRNTLLTDTDQSISSVLAAYGHGKNKKEARTRAAMQALKQFLDYDVSNSTISNLNSFL